MAATEAQKRAVRKNDKKAYDHILLRLKKGNKQIVQDFAIESGSSLNGFISSAVAEKIKKDFNENIDL